MLEEAKKPIQASEILAKIQCGEDVEIDHKIIEGDLDLSQLGETIQVISSKIIISNSEIVGIIKANNKIFSKQLSIRGTNSFKEADFSNAKFNSNADFNSAQFSDKVTFNGVQFSDDANFGEAKFRGNADFIEAKFSCNTVFSRVKFSGEANFSGANFSGHAFFNETQFCGNSKFNLARFSRIINFDKAQFEGDADFWGANFSSYVIFVGAKFIGIAIFRGTQFRGGAIFSGANFRRDVNFVAAQFNVDAIFMEAEFSGNADFMEADFSSDAVFGGAKFNGKADFDLSKFSDNADFKKAKFSGVNFSMAKFTSIADFSTAKFRGPANFRGAKFTDAIFNGSLFEEDADFNMAQFNGTVRFEESDEKKAQFHKSLKLDNCRIYAMYMEAEFAEPTRKQILLKYPDLNRVFVPWESIRDHLQYHGSAYLALIKNYNNLEWFEDADQCYYDYRKLAQSRKGDWYPIDSNRLIDKFITKLIAAWLELYSHFEIVIEDLNRFSQLYPLNRIYWFNWSKLIDNVSWISCGYGVKVERIILWILGSILIFASLYRISNVIVKTGSPITNGTSFLDCLYFSTMTLTGQIPASMYAPGAWMYMVAIEKLLGYLFLALFVVVLARKLIRQG